MTGAGWDRCLLPVGTLPEVERDLARGCLAEALPRFYRWQASVWPRLEQTLEGLGAVRTREVQLGERPVTIQWNPGRQASTAARIDRASLQERPCFLCPDNLPDEEKGLAIGEDLLLLVNPAPIAPLHLVVSHRCHTAQEFRSVADEAVSFAVDTAGLLTVFYNGPRCGASAPDHLHLQALQKGATVDERVVAERLSRGDPPGEVIVEHPGLGAWVDTGSSRTLLVLRGRPAMVRDGLLQILEAMEAIWATDEEPPINALLTADEDLLTALVYPRGAHRPSCYDAEGPARCLISPGALDMAGLVITVRQEDFDKVDRALLEQIFTETSVERRRGAELVEQLKRRMADG